VPSTHRNLFKFAAINLAMERSSGMQNNGGCFSRGCGWIKSLPERSKAKIVECARKIKKLGQDDPRRVNHSVKVGLAITLVSLFYYFEPLYDGFGDSAMWAVMTVVVVFEFSVGKLHKLIVHLYHSKTKEINA
jgi:hypothetical protein